MSELIPFSSATVPLDNQLSVDLCHSEITVNATGRTLKVSSSQCFLLACLTSGIVDEQAIIQMLNVTNDQVMDLHRFYQLLSRTRTLLEKNGVAWGQQLILNLA